VHAYVPARMVALDDALHNAVLWEKFQGVYRLTAWE